jgi:lysophospholipase L1-like esterase
MSKFKATDSEKEALEKYLLQFLNIEKLFPLLPGIENEASVADLMGIDHADLKKLRSLFRDNAKEAAVELLKDDEVAEMIEKLPFKNNDTIVAIGDSMTDDLQGWFEILKNMLDIAVPDAEFTFHNSGVSYNTSSDALRRLERDVLSKNPDWVLIALGTFDSMRLNIAPGRTLLPLSETWENLKTIEDAVMTVTDNPIVWITPPTVFPSLLEAMDLFDFKVSETDLRQVREVITGKKGYIVDPLGKRMGGRNPEAWYFLSDGLHPSLSGHLNTVKEVLKSLSVKVK